MRSTSYLFLIWLLFCELALFALHFMPTTLAENSELLSSIDWIPIFSTLQHSLVFDLIKAKIILLLLLFLSPILVVTQNKYINRSEFIFAETKKPILKAIIRVALGILVVLGIPTIDWTTRSINQIFISFSIGFGFLIALCSFFFWWFLLCIVKNLIFIFKAKG
jgi:hypothetical protein